MNFCKIAFVIFFCFASSAKAQTYFDIHSISPNLIDPALKTDSKEWAKEIEAIIKLQKNLDLEKIDQAVIEKKLRPETLVHFVDPQITRISHPKLYHLLDRTCDTSRGVTDYIKDYWQQTRPYLADSRVKMLISPSDGFSYPSGHTVGSYIYAHVLGLLIPDQQQNLKNYAKQIAQNRVLVGMHYQNDVAGGKQLAFLIVGGLAQNKDFQDDFIEAQKELLKK
jgi:hypothetical protein